MNRIKPDQSGLLFVRLGIDGDKLRLGSGGEGNGVLARHVIASRDFGPLAVKTFNPEISIRSLCGENLAGELVVGASFDGDLLGDAGGALIGRLELCLPIAVDLGDRGGGRETAFFDPAGEIL